MILLSMRSSLRLKLLQLLKTQFLGENLHNLKKCEKLAVSSQQSGVGIRRSLLQGEQSAVSPKGFSLRSNLCRNCEYGKGSRAWGNAGKHPSKNPKQKHSLLQRRVVSSQLSVGNPSNRLIRGECGDCAYRSASSGIWDIPPC